MQTVHNSSQEIPSIFWSSLHLFRSVHMSHWSNCPGAGWTSSSLRRARGRSSGHNGFHRVQDTWAVRNLIFHAEKCHDRFSETRRHDMDGDLLPHVSMSLDSDGKMGCWCQVVCVRDGIFRITTWTTWNTTLRHLSPIDHFGGHPKALEICMRVLVHEGFICLCKGRQLLNMGLYNSGLNTGYTFSSVVSCMLLKVQRLYMIIVTILYKNVGRMLFHVHNSIAILHILYNCHKAPVFRMVATAPMAGVGVFGARTWDSSGEQYDRGAYVHIILFANLHVWYCLLQYAFIILYIYIYTFCLS